MIPLRFYRDKTHVYVNNPDGSTKKMSIADFEAMLNGSGGGGDIPEHSSSNQGDVLSVDANGDLVWKTLPPAASGLQVVGYMMCENTDAVSIPAGTYVEPVPLTVSALYDADYQELESAPSFRLGLLTWASINSACSFDGYYAPDPVSDYDPTCLVSNKTQNSVTISAQDINMQFILLG